MDIFELLERLEQAIDQGRQVPFVGYVVDPTHLFDIIDQLRMAIPEEIHKARQLMRQKDRIIAQAQERAQRILQHADEQRRKLLDEQEIIKEAHIVAQQILQEAQREADQIRREADAYAYEVFTRMEHTLARALQNVQAGKMLLEESMAAQEPEIQQSVSPQAREEEKAGLSVQVSA